MADRDDFGGMNAEQQELYYALDAWLMTRIAMGRPAARGGPVYTWEDRQRHLNKLFVYMRALASEGMPTGPAALGEFDDVLNQIRILLPTDEDVIAFDDARDLLG